MLLIKPGIQSNAAFAALQVERSATEQDVKKAYRRLSLQLHPDKNPDPEAVPMFLKVNQAYRALTGTLSVAENMSLQPSKSSCASFDCTALQAPAYSHAYLLHLGTSRGCKDKLPYIGK